MLFIYDVTFIIHLFLSRQKPTRYCLSHRAAPDPAAGRHGRPYRRQRPIFPGYALGLPYKPLGPSIAASVASWIYWAVLADCATCAELDCILPVPLS